MWSKAPVLMLACLVTLSSCALLPPGWRQAVAATPAIPVSPTATAEDVLLEHQRLIALPASEQTREMLRLNASLPAVQASLQLALLLSHKGGQAELARAIGLLDRLDFDSSPELQHWQPLTRFLLTTWSEQRRLGERIERQAQQLKESQRKQDQLSETVAALKAIELSLPAKPAQAPGTDAGHAAAGNGSSAGGGAGGTP